MPTYQNVQVQAVQSVTDGYGLDAAIRCSPSSTPTNPTPKTDETR
jgi:hypothetical protein